MSVTILILLTFQVFSYFYNFFPDFLVLTQLFTHFLLAFTYFFRFLFIFSDIPHTYASLVYKHNIINKIRPGFSSRF